MSENISTPQRSIQLSLDSALDESLYDLTEEERTFFKQQTGIPDDDDLKAHIRRVQAEAYEVCIRQLETPALQHGEETYKLSLSKNRFILTLASVSSISQGEFLKMNTRKRL
jgi:hypothetical protein